MRQAEIGKALATSRAGRRRRRRIVPLHRVDAALLDAADTRWRKAAGVIGEVWNGLSPKHRTFGQIHGLARRVGRLVAAGKLQAAGDLRRIRFSEVRLPPAQAEGRQGK